MNAPWYIGALQPTLRHQKLPEERKPVYADIHEVEKKGLKEV